MAPTTTPPSSSDLLPHVLDVFERMELRKLSEPADVQALFRQQLTEAVTGACQEQGLMINEQAIAEAVEAHVAERALTSQDRVKAIAVLTPGSKKRPSLVYWLSQHQSILGVATGLSLATGIIVSMTVDTMTEFALPTQIVVIVNLLVGVGSDIWLARRKRARICGSA